MSRLKNMQVNSRVGTAPRNEEARDWAENKQAEIDALRTTGEYNPNVWNKVKDTWREGMMDIKEWADPVYGLDSNKDGDAIRDAFLEAERQKALQDFQNKGKEGYSPIETNQWKDLRNRGSY